MLGNHDLVINLPGSIIRLPLHAGALKAYYDFGLPRPDTVISSSAGAMATSAFAGWDADAFDEGVQIIGNLSPGQIFSFHRELKIKLAALGVASVGLGLMMLLDDNISKGKKTLLGVAGLSTLLATEGIVGRELTHGQSLLSIDPLINLLNSKLDFNAIFNSPIRLEVLVADMNQPGEVIFTNRHPLNSDPKNFEHRERWLKILRATSRLPGKFPFVKIDGIETVDGEVWTDFPIRQMKKYRKAIRFDYWPPLYPDSPPKDWISDLSRSFDIMRDRCTHKKIENYEYERQVDSDLPEVFYLRLSKEMIRQMPGIKIHSFTPDDMKLLTNIGYQLVKEQSPEIKKYLGV